MSAELQVHSRPLPASRIAPRTSAAGVLQTTARIWFIAAVAGQFIFAFAIASFYGLTAARGNMQAWNRHMLRGYMPADPVGNAVVAMHLLSAVVIIAAGALQFVPRIRNRYPALHRWNGRLYILAALTLTAAGLYMHWVRGSRGDAPQRWGATLNAVLIWTCAIFALRAAMHRDFKTHRRWALRLFIVVSAAWFYRATMFLILTASNGPVGFDPSTFTGPLLTGMAWGQTIVPLAILELYFLAQSRPGARRRIAMAIALGAITLAMVAGTLIATAAMWLPSIKAGFDRRESIASALSATIASNGIDQAIAQYREIKTSRRGIYNFDEHELNSLGYQLLQGNEVPQAIRIFQLNVEAYPRSSNTYDSLGEAYLRAGDRPRAIANYRRAVELDPKNRNSIAVLEKLGARDR